MKLEEGPQVEEIIIDDKFDKDIPVDIINLCLNKTDPKVVEKLNKIKSFIEKELSNQEYNGKENIFKNLNCKVKNVVC